MDFQTVTKKRASVRQFSPKKIPIEKITQIIDTANLAPCAGNYKTSRYIVIENQNTIEKIAEFCQQPFIEKAPCVVIICSDSNQLKRLYDIRANKYNKQQIGAEIENFLLKVTDFGLASCWVGAFAEEPIKNLLGIPENVEIEAVLPIGYELIKGKTPQRIKPSLITRLFFASWGNRFYKPLKKIRRKDI